MALEIKTLSSITLWDKVSRYDSQINAEYVDIPCNDDYSFSRDGFTGTKTKRVIYLNGLVPYENLRWCLYGKSETSSVRPTIENKPSWYNDPLTSFVIGHKYKFAYHILSGSQSPNGLATDHYFELRDSNNGLVYIGSPSDETSINVRNGIWICTFVPKMISVCFRKYTFTNAVIYLEIVDLTLQEQRSAIGHSWLAFESLHKTYTIGHSSGGNAGTSDPNIPENSIEGLVQYARQGYWGVSCDIRLTSDKVWVLMHDASVSRTTNGTGNVKDLPLDYIKDFYMKKGTTLTSYRVPTLREWLLAGRAYGMYLFVQIEGQENMTGDDIYNIVDTIRELDMVNQVALGGFDVDVLKYIKQYDSRIFTSALYHTSDFPTIGADGQLPAAVAELAKYGNVGVSVSQESTALTESQVRLYQKNGVKVGIWTAYPSTRARTKEILPYGFDFVSAEVCPNVMDLIYEDIEG